LKQRENMASITKRGKRWYAQIRRKGFPSDGRSFDSHAEAKAWAAIQDARVEQGDSALHLKGIAHISLGDVIRRYLVEITPTKRSADSERLRLEKLTRDIVAAISIAELSSVHIADYRNRRSATVSNGTVRRELSLIHHALDIARKEWGYRIVGNVVADVRQPPLHNARNRRLNAGEFDRLVAALQDARNALIKPMVLFAIETGMRRGEILDLSWSNVWLGRRVAYIPQTKTGHPRTIPLTDSAIAVLAAMPEREGMIFDLTANAFKLAWVRTVRRAKLPDLRFHDLRHEAISRFAEMGLTTVELSVISGHRDPRMLFRYAHLRPHELALKLAGRSWADEQPR
jgi:integrase